MWSSLEAVLIITSSTSGISFMFMPIRSIIRRAFLSPRFMADTPHLHRHPRLKLSHVHAGYLCPAQAYRDASFVQHDDLAPRQHVASHPEHELAEDRLPVPDERRRIVAHGDGVLEERLRGGQHGGGVEAQGYRAVGADHREEPPSVVHLLQTIGLPGIEELEVLARQ